MIFQTSEKFLSGTVVPLFSLKSHSGCGVGEFPDLKIFGQWCKASGIELIQLLPLQSTGENSSPYSADSSVALNLIYLRLADVFGADFFKKEITEFSKEVNTLKRFEYKRIYSFKMALLEQIYHRNILNIEKNLERKKWEEDNSWVSIFAVYRVLKNKYKSQPWSQWDVEDQFPDEKFITQYLQTHYEEALFYIWVQYEAHLQLSEASVYLDDLGIFLKGDIPILLDENSADVWYYRKYFKLDYKAGAPPDQFSNDGQNWGFPVYNWENLKKDNYEWWRLRLQNADTYYHAIRLDHVIGFLRIWQVEASGKTAAEGCFSPGSRITQEQLLAAGFTENEFHSLLNDSRGICLKEIPGTEDGLKRNEKGYYPLWFYYTTSVFAELSDEKKDILRQIVDDYYNRSEQIWESRGREILGFFKKSALSLFCAEDLGAVPKCTEKILFDSGILSLKVGRWTRKYSEPEAPFINPKEYPYYSVTTTSVHDTTTLADWWLNETEESNALAEILHTNTEKPLEEEGIFKKVLNWYLDSNSMLCIIALQDIFSISKKYSLGNPASGRINVPGTWSDMNWSYRIEPYIEELKADETFQKEIFDLLQTRKNR